MSVSVRNDVASIMQNKYGAVVITPHVNTAGFEPYTAEDLAIILALYSSFYRENISKGARPKMTTDCEKLIEEPAP